MHLLKHWTVFINGTKKLQQELWKNKRYSSPIIGYSACHRELQAVTAPQCTYTLLPLEFETPSLCLPSLQCRKPNNPQHSNYQSTPLLYVLSYVLHHIGHFIRNGIILCIPQEVLVQQGSGIKHVCFVKKMDLWQNYLPPPFLLLFLPVHLVSPAPLGTLQPNSLALR